MNKNILCVLLAILISTIAMPVSTAQVNNVDAHSVYVRYIDGASEVKTTISGLNASSVVYVENYYTTDSHGNQKLYASRRYETITNTPEISFNIYRPRDTRGTEYSIIERIVINKKVKTTLGRVDLGKYWRQREMRNN